MKRKGILEISRCFNPGQGVIRFDPGNSIAITRVPDGFKDGDHVVITLKDENGSAVWDMEHDPEFSTVSHGKTLC